MNNVINIFDQQTDVSARDGQIKWIKEKSELVSFHPQDKRFPPELIIDFMRHWNRVHP